MKKVEIETITGERRYYFGKEKRMPIISVRIIKNPRKYRRCSECLRHLDGETIDLFGMAHHGEKPYHLYMHRKCIISKDALSKIRAVELRNGADSEQDGISPLETDEEWQKRMESDGHIY